MAGRPDPEWGQRVAAFVVPRDPASPPTLAELRAYVRERLAAAKAPGSSSWSRPCPAAPQASSCAGSSPTAKPTSTLAPGATFQ